jgi:hypothetical protein
MPSVIQVDVTTSEKIRPKMPLVSQRADQTTPLSHGPSWKSEEQQRSQQRVYPEAGQPFLAVQARPDDAESYLDGLSSRNTELQA